MLTIIVPLTPAKQFFHSYLASLLLGVIAILLEFIVVSYSYFLKVIVMSYCYFIVLSYCCKFIFTSFGCQLLLPVYKFNAIVVVPSIPFKICSTDF